MIIIRQHLFSDPIYYQDGVMLRYNGNKIDDVKEILSDKEIKILDKILLENSNNIFIDNEDFIKRRGIRRPDKIKVMEIDIMKTRSNKIMYLIDCYYDKIPGIFTSEYDNTGKFLRSYFND